jgi:hypothetical protein
LLAVAYLCACVLAAYAFPGYAGVVTILGILGAVYALRCASSRARVGDWKHSEE